MIGVGKRKRHRRAESHQKPFFTAALDSGCISNAMDSSSRHNLESRAEVLGKANHIRGRPMPNDEDAGCCPRTLAAVKVALLQPFSAFEVAESTQPANTLYPHRPIRPRRLALPSHLRYFYRLSACLSPYIEPSHNLPRLLTSSPPSTPGRLPPLSTAIWTAHHSRTAEGVTAY